MHTKEELRQKRKEAYQKAKAKRDADPKYQAMKEQAKQARKDQYRAFRDRRKKAAQDEKEKIRAEQDAALMALMRPASELEADAAKEK